MIDLLEHRREGNNGLEYKRIYYTYSGGCYYSAILNDILSGRIDAFQGIQLYRNGLFDTYEQAETFRQYREHLMGLSKEYIFEKGDFVIYKLFEICMYKM